MNTLKAACRGGILLALAGLMVACAGTREPSADSLVSDARATVDRFVDRDPDLQDWVDNGHGYAVFPQVGKGGFIGGGAFGRGIVFERGEAIGRTSVKQVTLGAQIGGQSYSMIIFFQDQTALRTYQREQFEFSAQATAVAATSGAATSTSYERGVAVFILAGGGLMAEATIGAQQFTYEPL